MPTLAGSGKAIASGSWVWRIDRNHDVAALPEPAGEAMAPRRINAAHGPGKWARRLPESKLPLPGRGILRR